MEMGNLLFGNSRGKIALDRDIFQDPFCQGLAYIGYDAYGQPNVLGWHPGTEPAVPPEHDDLFIIRPYWWGDEDAPEAELPNFEVPSANLSIQWYKYALRDSYANREFTLDEMIHIFSDLHDKLVERGWNFELYCTCCEKKKEAFRLFARARFQQLAD